MKDYEIADVFKDQVEVAIILLPFDRIEVPVREECQ